MAGEAAAPEIALSKALEKGGLTLADVNLTVLSFPDMISAFANQENSGLDRAQVFTYWQCDVKPDSHAQRVLNYLGESSSTTRGQSAAPPAIPDPAITLHALGNGHVVFVSTTANASKSLVRMRRSSNHVMIVQLPSVATASGPARGTWSRLLAVAILELTGLGPTT